MNTPTLCIYVCIEYGIYVCVHTVHVPTCSNDLTLTCAHTYTHTHTHTYTRTYNVCVCMHPCVSMVSILSTNICTQKHSLCICTYVLSMSMVVTYTCVCIHNTCTTCTCTCMSYCIATNPPNMYHHAYLFFNFTSFRAGGNPLRSFLAVPHARMLSSRRS